MAFNEQEKALILWGKENGKTAQEIETAVAKLRAGIQPTPTEAAAPRSTIADVAIGAAKGLTETVRAANPLQKLNELQGRDTDWSRVTRGAEDALRAQNTPQMIGKGVAVAGEVLTPFVAGRLAGLAARGLSAVKEAPASSGVPDLIKRGVETVTEFAKNPRLALAKRTVEPQLESSAQRLFLEQTARRAEDPLASYEQYLAQSKKALADIKEDPAIAQVGEKIGDEFRFVIDRRRQAGQVMGDELKKVGGIKTNIDDAFTQLETAMKDADVTYSATKKRLTPGKASKMTAEDQSLLESYIAELNKLGSEPTVAEIDGMIARTQGLVSNFKSAKGITDTTNAERLIKQNQAALRQQLDPAKSGKKELENYARARALYAELSDFIDDGAQYLGKITQSGDFAKDASIAKSAVQSILNNGKKDWLARLEELTGYPALDDAVLALQAMKDAGDFRGLSLLESLSQSVPTSQAGITQKMLDFALDKVARAAAGTPEEQTRIFLNALKEAAQQSASQ